MDLKQLRQMDIDQIHVYINISNDLQTICDDLRIEYVKRIISIHPDFKDMGGWAHFNSFKFSKIDGDICVYDRAVLFSIQLTIPYQLIYNEQLWYDLIDMVSKIQYIRWLYDLWEHYNESRRTEIDG